MPCQKTGFLREPKTSCKLLFKEGADKDRTRTSTAHQKQQIKNLFSQAAFSKACRREEEDVKENEPPKAQTPNPNKLASYHTQFRSMVPRNLFPAESESSVRNRSEKLRSDLEETPHSKSEYR